MSAWLCSQDHLNLIVNAHPNPELRNGQSFHLLLNENLRSLSARYSDSADWQSDAADYRFEAIEPWDLIKRVYGEQAPDRGRFYAAITRPITGPAVAAQIRKACDSYGYQSCETDDYDTTPAAAFVKEVFENYGDHPELEKGALWAF